MICLVLLDYEKWGWTDERTDTTCEYSVTTGRVQVGLGDQLDYGAYKSILNQQVITFTLLNMMKLPYRDMLSQIIYKTLAHFEIHLQMLSCPHLGQQSQ